jgi:glycosyltransferase involved in cell wall biosynthesis
MVFSYLTFKTNDSPPVLMMLHDYGVACPKKTALFHPGDTPCSGPGFKKCLSCAADQYGKPKAGAIVTGQRFSNAALLRRVDGFAANSAAVADFTRSVAGSIPISVVSSFVTDDAFAGELPRPSWLPDGEFIFYAGALGGHKGIDDLINAYGELPKSAPPLVVAGLPKPDMPTNWPDGVLLRLNVPHEEVLAAWRHCLFGVIPSRWSEPFGMVAIEAAAAGKSVVATKVGGLGEVVIDEFTGLQIPPNDVSALASAMARLVSDAYLRERLGAAARQHSESFRLSVVVDRLDDLCYSLTATSR